MDHERMLRDDEARRLLHELPEAVLVTDESGFVRCANVALEALAERPLADLVGKHLMELLPGETVRSLLDAEGGEAPGTRRDAELRRRDGSTVWVELSAAPCRDPDAIPTGSLVVLRDVGEERLASQELSRKNVELEHYVHAISHDLRSPLVSLLGFSRLLREDYGERLDDKGRHFLERIEQAGRTMESLIHHLLELSRIGKNGDCKTLIDAGEVLLQLRAELKPRMDAAGIQLDLPERTPRILCDRMRLYQLLSNLIGNAVQHMGDAAAPRISVEIREEEDHHCIVVSDNGRGIDPAEHDRIFQPFETISTCPDQRTTGIGLAIVKKIVETHGGRCWVESEPGAGARFHLTLPRT